MARRTRATDQEQPTAMVASARRFKVDRGDSDPMKGAKSNSDSWQRAAWHFFDVVGEYRFAAEWVGSQLSKARLFATYDDGKGPKEVEPNSPADQILDTFFNGEDGQSQMLADVGTHYTVAGECYFVGLPDDDGEGEEWAVFPSSKVKRTGGKYELFGKPAPEGATIIQTWRPHPNDPKSANSPTRAALPILSEIERLTMHVAAQVDSRLASAGILFLPKEMTFSAEGGTTADGKPAVGGSASAFVKTLYDVMSTSIANREDASALVPIVITAEAEYLDKANLMTFWTDLDENAIELRKEALRRLGLALDMPPEIVTGTGEMNHWGAWAVDEAAIKSHTEPLLMRIAQDIVVGMLRPALMELEGLDKSEARRYSIGIDTSEMRLRPNRSKEALELHDRGELSSTALLRETGFDEKDAPTPEEKKEWLLRKVASQTTTPEVVAQALALLGLAITPPPSSDDEAGNERTHESPSLTEHPANDPPSPENSEAIAAAALSAAAEQMVFRALERAGNRLKTKVRAPKMPGVEAPELYLWHSVSPALAEELLDGAWDRTSRFAGRFGMSPDSLNSVLDSYCRVLLTEQKPHDQALLERYLALTKVTH